jgi:hypothetical protein
MSDDTDNKKLYRVDWKYIDLAKGVDEDYAYIGATNPVEATNGIPGTDFVVREASIEEMEAFVAGYEDGYNMAIISTKLEDLDAGLELEIEDEG